MTELLGKSPYPGRLVEDEVAAQSLPLTTAKAAATLGVTRRQLYRLGYEERKANADRDLRLNPMAVVDAEHWVRMETGHKTAQRGWQQALDIARRLDASKHQKK